MIKCFPDLPAPLFDQRPASPPVHGLQNSVTAVLDGNVEIRKHMPAVPDRIEKIIRYLIRIEVENPQPVQPFQSVEFLNKIGKHQPSGKIDAIAGTVLRDQGDFLHSAFDQCPGLFDNLLHFPRDEGSPDQRNRAVAAAVVAAVRDAKIRHPRLSRKHAGRFAVGMGNRHTEFFAQDFIEMRIFIDRDKAVHFRHLLFEFRLVALG